MQNAGMEYLETRLMFGMVPGLSSTRKICDALGNPEKKFKSIHVVGTNGKGSTSFYLAGVLRAHGLKTGLYTSPHLVNLRERIRVDDLPIGESDLDRLILQVRDAAKSVNVEPTFFEVLTLVAFLYYAEQGVDVAVLEAGMGGRLDSTAVAGGDVAVVTSIGLEHTEVLGPTESAILGEKMRVVGETAADAHGKMFVIGGLSADLLGEARELARELQAGCIVPEIRDDIALPNLGRHYVENASLSLAAARLFLTARAADSGSADACASAASANALRTDAYDDALALNCLRNRSWAGRMQQLTDAAGNVRVILDGAHNSHAVRRLVQTLARYYPGKKFHCVFGALKDKDVGEMLKLMAPHVSHWHITRTPYPRFRELSDLHSELDGLGLNVASEGDLCREYIDCVMRDAKGAEPLLVTGSLYMIGATIELLRDDFDGLSFFRGLDSTTNEHR